MPEEKGDAREISLRQVLPWTEIFRAFTIALGPSKLLLATMAVVLMWFGWYLLALIFNQPNEFGQWPADAPRGANPFVVMTERPGSILTTDFWVGSSSRRPAAGTPAASGTESSKKEEANGEPATKETEKPAEGTESARANAAKETTGQPPVHLEPFHKFLRPLLGLFKSTPGERVWWYLLLGVILTVVVWGIFGGAITRIAAVQYARNEQIGMIDALKFSSSKFVHFLSAPLIPFAVLAVIAILMFLGGLLLNIPYVGDVLASLLWFLPLMGAVFMAIGLLGYVGWPLMYATISAEGSDNFDALSRSYIYVFSRPLHYLWYTFVAVLFGVVVTFFVVFVTSMTVHLARWGVGLSSGANMRVERGYFGEYDWDPVQALFVYAPSSYDWDRLLMFGREHEKYSAAQFETERQRVISEMHFFTKLSAGIMAFWLHLLFLVMLGFAYSFFWSASTIIYFLLRKRVDDTEMDEVYVEEEDEAYLTPPPSTLAPTTTGAGTLPMVDPPRSPGEPGKSEQPTPKPAGGDGPSTGP
jgi:hypothetical protein